MIDHAGMADHALSVCLPAHVTCYSAVPPPAQATDRVVYSKFAGTEIEVEGVEHILLKVGTCGPA